MSRLRSPVPARFEAPLSALSSLTWPSWRVLTAGGAIVVLIAGLGVGAWLWRAEQNRHAEAAYTDAIVRLQMSQTGQAAPDSRASAVRDLEATLARYPSAPQAAQAAYELANIRFASRDYASARGAYEVAAARATAPTLRILARAGIAYAWEAEKNFAKAADAFRVAATDVRPGDFLFEQLVLDLARVQEAGGQKNEAIETYRRFLKEAPKSRRADDVRLRLASLGTTP
ncbi:MAG TPA: tetratricopeptide repeat protein [Methylomirabilota bacterium]